MSFIKDIVENPHPIYSNNYRYWEFLLQSYEGGHEYTNAQLLNKNSLNSGDNLFRIFANGKEVNQAGLNGNLFKHPKERMDDYYDRIRMSYFYNFCAPVIQIYTNHLFKQTIKSEFENLEDSIAVVENDIDFKGGSIDEFRKQISEMAQLYGHCYVISDSPQIDAPILTRQQQIDQRAFPYLSLISPQCVLNWSLDRFGNPYWVVIKEYEDVNIDFKNFDCNKMSMCNYRVWDRDSWYLYDSEYNLIKEGYHGLGFVPITCVFNKKSKKAINYLGISTLADISFIARDIYNSCSELKQILRDQTFAILVLQGESSEYNAISVGTSRGLLYPADRQAPQFISPQYQNAQVYFDHIDRQVKKIYQLAKLESGSAAVGQTAVQQSGVSKAWDFNETNSTLNDLANNLEDGENKIWKNFGLWLGVEWDGYVQYPTEFSVQSLMQDLDEAEKIARVDLGKTFLTEVKKSIQKKKFPSAKMEELEQMEKELESVVEDEITQSARNILNRIPSFNRFNNANSGGQNGG